MIPDSETPECPEFDVRSTIRKIFDIEDILEEYSDRIYKIDPYFYEHYNKKKKKKKKYRLMKMVANTYYLELIIILLNIS